MLTSVQDSSGKSHGDVHASQPLRVICHAFLTIVITALLSQGSVAQTRSISELYLLTAANQARTERGLPLLRLDPQLERAALLHAREMAAHRTISHQFSGELDLAARAEKAGAAFSLVTENVAEASNSALIHELWMQSSGHRANLLDPKVDAIGVAVIAFRGQLYAVQDFAHTVQRLSLEDQESRVEEVVSRSGLKLLSANTDARQTCQLSSGYAGVRQPWFIMRYTSSDLSILPEELSKKLATGQFRFAEVGACLTGQQTPFTSYSLAVLLYP